MLTSILKSLESLEVYCYLFSTILIGSLAALTSRAPVMSLRILKVMFMERLIVYRYYICQL